MEITKEMHQSLKLVSVHYRNKAWINNIGFFPSKVTVNNIYSITVHFDKVIEN